MTAQHPTRALNTVLVKEVGLNARGKFSIHGSFYAFRIEDINGLLTVKDADKILKLLHEELPKLGLKTRGRGSYGYWYAGVVFNFEIG